MRDAIRVGSHSKTLLILAAGAAIVALVYLPVTQERSAQNALTEACEQSWRESEQNPIIDAETGTRQFRIPDCEIDPTPIIPLGLEHVNPDLLFACIGLLVVYSTITTTFFRRDSVPPRHGVYSLFLVPAFLYLSALQQLVFSYPVAGVILPAFVALSLISMLPAMWLSVRYYQSDRVFSALLIVAALYAGSFAFTGYSAVLEVTGIVYCVTCLLVGLLMILSFFMEKKTAGSVD